MMSSIRRCVLVLIATTVFLISARLVNSIDLPTTREEFDALLATSREYAERHQNFIGYLQLGYVLFHHHRTFHIGGWQLPEAAEAFTRALSLDDSTEDTLQIMLNLATAYKEMGKTEGALDVLNRAIQRDDFQIKRNNIISVEIYQLRQELFGTLNMKKESLENLLLAFKLSENGLPGPHASNSFAYWTKDSFRKYKPDWALDYEEYLSRIEEAARKDENGNPFTAMRYYALFEIYDKLARNAAETAETKEDREKGIIVNEVSILKEKAWNNLQYGSTMYRAMLRPSLHKLKLEHETFMSMFKDPFAQMAATVPKSDKNIIFVVGLPRSGSTLIEQILDSHSRVTGIGEDSRFSAYVGENVFPRLITVGTDVVKFLKIINEESIKVLDENLRSVYNMNNASIVVDKLLSNYLKIGLIHMLLPHAKVVHTFKKQTTDAKFSLFKKQFQQNTAIWSYDWKDLSEYFDMYHDLMDHWHKTYPGFILDFPYEDLVSNPEAQARKLLKFCELEWEDGILNFSKNVRAIQTHSINQVNKPLYKDAVGSWRFYEEYITPLLQSSNEDSDSIARETAAEPQTHPDSYSHEEL